MSRNPFTPSDPIARPEDFVGRAEQLLAAVDALVGGSNVLITGYRGIGKTSLAEQVLHALRTSGEGISAVARVAFPSTSPLIGSFTCLPDSTLPEIADGLLASLRRSAGETRKITLKGEVALGPFKGGVEYKDIDKALKSVAADFVHAVYEIALRASNVDRAILLLIDEIDVIKRDIPVGAFVKAVKESLRNEGNTQLAFLLVGQSGVAHTLIEHHPSVGRTLAFVEIPRMSRAEIDLIFSRAAEGSSYRFDPEVTAEIVNLSHGFPSVAQLLGYQSCFVDDDNYIDVLDFEQAATNAAAKLRAERYVADVKDLVDRPNALRILEALCDMADDVVAARDLHKAIGDNLTVDELKSELSVLAESDLISMIDSNSVKLKDRLIAIYYSLKSLKTPWNAAARSAVRALRTRGYICTVVNARSHDEIIDLVASRPIKRFWFFPGFFRIGIASFNSPQDLSKGIVERLIKNAKSAIQVHNLEYILIASPSTDLRPEIESMLQASGIPIFSIGELATKPLETY